MKKAKWGFSFKKFKKYFLKQLCLYFIFEVNGIKKNLFTFQKDGILFAYFQN